MGGNFIADIKLEDSDEVLQLPVITSRLHRRLLASSRKGLEGGANDVIPNTSDSLEHYLQLAGRLFDRDPCKWVQMGDFKTETTEENNKRIIKKTGVFSGTELHLFVEMPHYDPRLVVTDGPKGATMDEDMIFTVRRREAASDMDWQALIAEQPWTPAKRRVMLTKYLQAKLQAEDITLQLEGAQGLLELGLNKAHHADIGKPPLAALLKRIESVNYEVVQTVCAAIWALATSSQMRRKLAELDVVPLLIRTAKRTVAVKPMPDTALERGELTPGVPTCSQRDTLQAFVLGALSVLVVDRVCRSPLLALEPDMSTIFMLCKNLEGYEDAEWVAERRMVAGKVLTNVVQRDHDARLHLVEAGALSTMLALLHPEGPGHLQVQFCMASTLALLVLDDRAMHLIQERGEAPMLFDACITLLAATLESLVDCNASFTPDDMLAAPLLAPPREQAGGDSMEPKLAVRLAEACGQGLWGAAYYCITYAPEAVKLSHVVQLGHMGSLCMKKTSLPLGRVCHCIAATLSVLSSNAIGAQLIMNVPGKGALQAIMNLIAARDTNNFQLSGHVQAASCCALAFLALHPIGAKGDECLTGPYRETLLEVGAFRGLLTTALFSDAQGECHEIIQQAAAVGLMFLSTMAGEVEATDLAMYAKLMTNTVNVQMVEFLLAGMWILLRTPHNRQVLGTAFSKNPDGTAGEGDAVFAEQITDTIDVHDVTSNVQKQLETQSTQKRLSTADGSLPGTPKTPSTTGGFGSSSNLDDSPDHQDRGSSSHRSRRTTRDPGPQTIPEEQEGPVEGWADSRSSTAQGAQVFVVPEAGIEDDEVSSPKRSPDPNHKGSVHFGEEEPLADTAARGGEISKEQEEKILPDNKDWGLETLVKVGENWLPRLHSIACRSPAPRPPSTAPGSSENTQEMNDTALLKLFEFLTASLCLYVIDDDESPVQRKPEVFSLGAAQGCNRPTWWTVDAPAPLPDHRLDGPLERAVTILLTLLRLHMVEAWKALQLTMVTLWNASARSPGFERHIIEQAVAIPLLEIIPGTSWPASVRDIAAALLQSLAETQHGVDNMGGQIPLITALTTLVNSRIPLLEMRGARGIARVCYQSPLGCKNPTSAVHDAKAHAAQLGSIEALVALIRRLNKRFNMLLVGQAPVADTDIPLDDHESHLYERNMATAEAIQEMYMYTLAALLNLSTLRTNQPLIAKAGLLTLLGTSSMLQQVLDGGSEGEQTLLFLCSSIIQNLAQHPKNRTRFFRAELTGTVALEQQVQDALNGTLRTAASKTWQQATGSALPPVHPAVANLEKLQKGSAWTAPDAAASVVMRPKVVFPPVMDKTARLDEPDPGARMIASPSKAERPSSGGSPRRAGAPAAYGNDSRMEFLDWLEGTFAELEGGATDGMDKEMKAKKTHRRMLWDENGEWLAEEVEGRTGLQRLLARPLSHLWQDTPEARKRFGAQRWQPAVSEYRESKNSKSMSKGAARLLSTAPIAENEPLMGAAVQITISGRADNADPSRVTLQRPGTATRRNGRQALTVLQLHAEAVTAESARRFSRSADLSDAEARAAEDAMRSSAPEMSGRLAQARSKAVPLKVVLAPQRGRTVMSFEDRINIDNDPMRPTLTIFEHVDGARVYNELLDDYQLPNGRRAFMYYNGGGLIDEFQVDAADPPPKPNTVPQALQQGMPLGVVLDKISKPPGSAPPFTPYKPTPKLVPLPDRHTLSVKQPESLEAAAFGDLREDNLQLTLQAKKIIKTQTQTRVEDIVAAVAEVREPWTLPNSIFKPRQKDSDAKDFFDSPQVVEKMYERDWQRATGKDKFTSMMARENKSNKVGKDDAVALKEVHDVLKKHFTSISSAFTYYAAQGSGSPYHMPLNAYTSFMDDCQIPDPESLYIKRSDCDTIFIVCNFVPDKKAPEAQVKQEHTLMRYEFLEALVRMAIAKYGKGVETDDIAEAVTMLLENNLLPNMPPAAAFDPNLFRTGRLYNEEVDMLMKKHMVLLKALYSRYRLKPVGGGLRTKVLKIDGWQAMMNDAHLVDGQFTLADATMTFLWARMAVVDEVKDFAKYSSASFVDFLEALGYVADMKSLPSSSELDQAGYKNVLEWALEKERIGEAGEAETDSVPPIFRPRPSCGISAPKMRPLYAKLEVMLDLLFRRLFWDPANPESEFSYDAFMRLIKKIDKDMGP